MLGCAAARLATDTRSFVLRAAPSVFLLCVIGQSHSSVGVKYQQRSQQRVFYASEKEKPHSLLRNCGVYLVAWDGIEPSTRGFSIRCSTN